jgi:hypothetical protein
MPRNAAAAALRLPLDHEYIYGKCEDKLIFYSFSICGRIIFFAFSFCHEQTETTMMSYCLKEMKRTTMMMWYCLKEMKRTTMTTMTTLTVPKNLLLTTPDLIKLGICLSLMLRQFLEEHVTIPDQHKGDMQLLLIHIQNQFEKVLNL